ncbi:hypothetical protein O181_072785 [Austropuccinia psidii MF-1]|uniref:Uncharacterized protein n=1 Tax=Austropuccinia psidii MF-1 TaxID=1389203 RepID=A0A9Q3F177_9BASI|nr:hypothetical protein [Austropuccinia psidii MF-1]
MKRVGPKPMMRARGPRTLLGYRERGPGPKKKVEAWGLRIWELAREVNDGRIWPDAIIGQGRAIWVKGCRAPDGAKLAIKIWCGQLAPTWSQVGIATTPIEEDHSSWL